MGQRALFPIPADINPANRRCVLVRVPDDPQHIANFMGALYELTLWLNYDRDTAHSGKDVAAVWYGIYEQLTLDTCPEHGTGDDMQFRQNGCKLEYSIDCTTWYTLYDPTDCIQAAISQPPGGGELATDECRTFDVTLRANDRYLLPVPVSEGYTLTVSAGEGGWYDGGEGIWHCPDGSTYVLGACAGSGGFVVGDPMPSEPHMLLIGKLEAVSPVYYHANNSVITIPAGVTPTNFSFQANDSDITNNSGSIKFTVKVCAAAPPTWSHTFDFTVNDGGWAASPTDRAEYVAATGWRHQTGSDWIGLIQIQSPAIAATIITSVEMFLSAAMNGPDQNMQLRYPNVGGVDHTIFAGTSTDILNDPADTSATGLWVGAASDNRSVGAGGVSYTGYITKIIVTGKGSDPF